MSAGARFGPEVIHANYLIYLILYLPSYLPAPTYLVVGAAGDLPVAGERAVMELTRAHTAIRLDVEVRAGGGCLRTT